MNRIHCDICRETIQENETTETSIMGFNTKMVSINWVTLSKGVKNKETLELCQDCHNKIEQHIYTLKSGGK